MNWSLLASSYGAVFGNVQVLLMTFLGALGGVLLGAIPGMTATMGVALLIPFSFGMDLIPSIGLLLCKSKNDLVAEYALKDMSKPMGVSAYKVTSSLPEELQRQLPSIEDIEKRIQKE